MNALVTRARSGVRRTDCFDELVSVFLGGLNKDTLDCYRRSLADFTRYVGVKSPSQAIAFLCRSQGECNLAGERYKRHLMDQGRSPNTVGNCPALTLMAKGDAAAAFRSGTTTIQNEICVSGTHPLSQIPKAGAVFYCFLCRSAIRVFVGTG